MNNNQKILKAVAGFVVFGILSAIGQAIIMIAGSSGSVLFIHLGGSALLIAVSIIGFLRPRTHEYAIGALLFCLLVLLPVLLVYSRIFATGSLMD